MNVFPIQSSRSFVRPVFRGQMVSYPAYENESYLKLSSLWHKNSTVEKTVDSFHSQKTGKAYYASPMENINDYVKEAADYIVYDNEPEYPDVNEEISKNYFGTQRKNYRKDFEEIRDYYYRREMGGFADKADAKYQQWQAAECIRMYDNAGHLRYLKETTEDNITDLAHEVSDAKKTFAAKEAELQKQKVRREELNSRIENSEEKSSLYRQLKEMAEGCPEKDEEEKVFISSQLSKIKRNMVKYNQQLKSCNKMIDELNTYIINFPQLLESLELQIKTNVEKVSELKAKLIPMFDELKNFYVKQGIKSLKK